MSTEYIRYPSNTGGGGGGGSFTGVTGNPNQIAYFDSSGNGTGDAQATRLQGAQFLSQIQSNTYAQAIEDNGGTDKFFIQADNVGQNPIVPFDGFNDAGSNVAAYNLANPSATVTLLSNPAFIPSAINAQMIGGGVTGLNTGVLNLIPFGVDFQASGLSEYDGNTFNFSLVGNLSPIFGTTKSGLLSGSIGSASQLGLVIATYDKVQMILTDQNTYNAQIQADAGGAGMQYNADFLGLQQGYGAAWGNGNNNVTYYLPSNNTGYNLYDSLQIVNISGGGSQIFLDFQPGSGGGVGLGEVAYGDINTGIITSGSNFTYNQTTDTFEVLGGGAKLTVNGNAGSQFFSAQGLIEFSNQNTGNSTLRLSNQYGKYSFGDVDQKNSGSNIEIWDFNQPSIGQVYINGYRNIVQSAISFSGTGFDLNDLSVTGRYNGGVANNNFSFTITHLNVQRIDVTPGYVGVFPSIGDPVNFSGGFGGNVYDTDGSSYFWVENLAGSVAPSEAVTGLLGFVGTVQSTDLGFRHDAGDFVNGGTSALNVPTILTPYTYIQGIAPSFQNDTGHTVGNIWSWTESISFDKMAVFDGQYHTVYIGDVGNVGNATYSLIDDDNYLASIKGSFAGTTKGAGLKLKFDTQNFRLGDADNIRGGTIVEVDDSGSNIINTLNGSFILKNSGNLEFFHSQYNGGGHFTQFGDLSGAGNFTRVSLDDAAQTVTITNRFEESMGSGMQCQNNAICPSDGNMFVLDNSLGVPVMDRILTTNWQSGSRITLIAFTTVTLNHMSGSGGSYAEMYLKGATNFVFATNNTIDLRYDGVSNIWREVCRTV